jgi:PHD-finger
MIICERCNKAVHPECVVQYSDTAVNDGPWICQACRREIILHGCEDIYYDFGLLDYLFMGSLPDSVDERARIKKLASEFRGHGQEL